MKNRIIPLLLILVLCLDLFAGCQSSELRAYSDDESAADTEDMVKDYTPVYESFAPDTVMLTVNGLDVTWQELFYWYHYDVSSIESYYGDITDWDAPAAFDETYTYRELIMEDAFEVAKYYRVLESKCAENGITLSQEDLDEIDASWQANAESYGGEEALIEYYESVFMTKELFYYFSRITALYYAMQEEICGTDGDGIGEEEILAKAEEAGYMRAKHILLKTIDDEGVSISDEEKAEKLETAEAILAELQAISDSGELEAKLDELMAEYSEDTGTAYYPDGYTFLTGEMMEEFENAVTELGDYEISGIVETYYGYHIILRLPLSMTATVDYSDYYEAYSLGYITALEIFTSMIDSWVEESEAVLSKEYEGIDLAELFSKAKMIPAVTE